MNKTRRAGLCAPYLKIWQAFKKEKRIALTLRGMLIRIKQKKKTKKEVLETDGNGKEQTGARA